MKTKFLFFVCLFFLSFAVRAWQPSADTVTTGMFLGGSEFTLANTYFVADPANGDSYILRRCQNGAVTCSNPVNSYLTYWGYSNLNYPDRATQYDELIPGYPGFSENRWFTYPRGQCVAFAKVATNTESFSTGSWYANGQVQSLGSYTYDNSYSMMGKMIGYFPNGNGSQYPNGTNGYGHVGVFLKYQYPTSSFNLPFLRPIGFWILDENFSGNGDFSNWDGKIRKHLILFNTGTRHKNGSNYYFVDIRWHVS